MLLTVEKPPAANRGANEDGLPPIAQLQLQRLMQKEQGELADLLERLIRPAQAGEGEGDR
jgi:hypothetical protein